MIQDASQCCNSQSVCLQGQSDHSKGKFVQPPQLVWLAMNVLLTLIKPKAMVALLEQVWPGLVDALLQESERSSQHMWMIMGCLRTIIQVLGPQVFSNKILYKMYNGEALHGVVFACSCLSYISTFDCKLLWPHLLFIVYLEQMTSALLHIGMCTQDAALADIESLQKN